MPKVPSNPTDSASTSNPTEDLAAYKAKAASIWAGSISDSLIFSDKKIDGKGAIRGARLDNGDSVVYLSGTKYIYLKRGDLYNNFQLGSVIAEDAERGWYSRGYIVKGLHWLKLYYMYWEDKERESYKAGIDFNDTQGIADICSWVIARYADENKVHFNSYYTYKDFPTSRREREVEARPWLDYRELYSTFYFAYPNIEERLWGTAYTEQRTPTSGIYYRCQRVGAILEVFRNASNPYNKDPIHSLMQGESMIRELGFGWHFVLAVQAEKPELMTRLIKHRWENRAIHPEDLALLDSEKVVYLDLITDNRLTGLAAIDAYKAKIDRIDNDQERRLHPLMFGVTDQLDEVGLTQVYRVKTREWLANKLREEGHKP